MKKFLSGASKFLVSPMSLPFVFILSLMLLSALFMVNMVRKSPETFGLLKGPEILQKEQEELVAQVGSLISLPEDEQPTVATVSDKSQLGEQIFFKNAEDGDKVLIYANASKVVLYRPSENRVVEVGTVNIQQVSDGVEGESDETANKFVILNSTQISGLASTMEKDLKDVFSEAEVVSVGNASTTYDNTIIVSLLDSDDQAKNLARSLGIELADLPEGEERPANADFLIIVGSDKAPETETSEESSE